MCSIAIPASVPVHTVPVPGAGTWCRYEIYCRFLQYHQYYVVTYSCKHNLGLGRPFIAASFTISGSFIHSPPECGRMKRSTLYFVGSGSERERLPTM